MNNQGNMIVVWIIIIVVVFFGVGYLLRKYQRISVLNKTIDQKDYKKLLTLCEELPYRKMLGDFTCDLYRFYALRSSNQMDALKEALEQGIQFYGGKDLEKLLELYYHYFLVHGDYKYAEKLLNDIRDTNLESFILCSEWSYQVIAQGRNDLFNEMEDAVNDNTFKGFSLGVILYLMGLQLEHDGDYEQAKGYYETATQCFVTDDIYMTLCKRHMEQIDEKLDVIQDE